MSEGKATQPDLEKQRAALNAAGYCGEPYPDGGGFCCRLPGRHSDGYHVDYYNGRQGVTDTEGYRWPQR